MIYEYKELLTIQNQIFNIMMRLNYIIRKIEMEAPEDLYSTNSKELENSRKNWEKIDVSKLQECLNYLNFVNRNIINQINYIKNTERYKNELSYHYY
jgi:hypothetical protein